MSARLSLTERAPTPYPNGLPEKQEPVTLQLPVAEPAAVKPEADKPQAEPVAGQAVEVVQPVDANAPFAVLAAPRPPTTERKPPVQAAAVSTVALDDQPPPQQQPQAPSPLNPGKPVAHQGTGCCVML